jgi:hypothetical protein
MHQERIVDTVKGAEAGVSGLDSYEKENLLVGLEEILTLKKAQPAARANGPAGP